MKHEIQAVDLLIVNNNTELKSVDISKAMQIKIYLSTDEVLDIDLYEMREGQLTIRSDKPISVNPIAANCVSILPNKDY